MAAISPLLFQGTLLNRQGNPITDARIQLWQTDLDGNYLHSRPDAAGSAKNPEHASIVDDFQYFGTDATDSNGKFDFLTYRPGIYSVRPYSHFHFMVWLEEPVVSEEDGEEPLPALWTQFYFEGGAPPSSPDVLALAVTEVDAGMYNYGSYVNGTIVVDDGSSEAGGGTLLPVSPREPLGPFYPEINFFSMDNDLTTTSDNDATTQTDPFGSPTKQPTTKPVAENPSPSMPESTNNPTKKSGSNPVTDGPTTEQSPTQSPVTNDGSEIKPKPPSTAPTSQSASSPAATAWNSCFGLIGVFWLVAYHAFLANCSS